MDEVDGMGGSDRGGIQELIQLIKKTRVPIIAICNDRQHQKIRCCCALYLILFFIFCIWHHSFILLVYTSILLLLLYFSSVLFTICARKIGVYSICVTRHVCGHLNGITRRRSSCFYFSLSAWFRFGASSSPLVVLCVI